MTPLKVASPNSAANAAASIAGRRGQMAPMLAILVFALFAFTGVVLDGGRIQFEKRHMQLAADAAAMGGAHEIMRGNSGQIVVDAAREDAQLNKFVHHDNNDGNANALRTTVAVNNPPQSGPRAGDAGFVEVIITRSYPTTFMRIIGIQQAPVRARAVAGMVNYGESCVLALNPTERGALTISGTADLTARCGVQVNSNDSQALVANGGGHIDARPVGIGVFGNYVDNGCSGSCFSPPPAANAPQSVDYLGHIAEPTVPGGVTTVYEVGGDPGGEPALGLSITGGTWNLQPGLYSGSVGPGNKVNGIDISGGVINLYPGIYFLDSGMKLTGGTVIRTVGTNGLPGGPDEGVMFYQTTTSTQPHLINAWNEIDIAGTVQANLKPMTSGVYKGILFFEDRRAPKLNPGHSLLGTADSTYDGVLYFRNGHVIYGGTSSTGGWTGIIADTINIVGTTQLSNNFLIDADGETPFRTAMLVE